MKKKAMNKMKYNNYKLHLFNNLALLTSGLFAFIAIVLTNLIWIISFITISVSNPNTDNIYVIIILLSILYLIMYSLFTTNSNSKRYSNKIRQFVKRLADVIFASSVIFLFLPFMILISLNIKLSSKGSILIGSVRVGQGGKKFKFFRFRTLYSGTTKLTPIGTILRRYFLDELPQIYNVLEGDMSIIGPRPLFERLYDPENERIIKILTVKPGITGLGLLNIKKDDNYETLLNYDLDYVEQWTLWLDIKILFRTIFHHL